MKQRFFVFFFVFLLLSFSFCSVGFGFDYGHWYQSFDYRKLITVDGVVGAGVGYVVYVNVSFASGTDGVSVLSGGYSGVNASLVFVDGDCQADFGDIRFTNNHGDDLLGQWMDSKVDSSYSLWAVKMVDDLGSDVSFYIYYGDSSAVLVSDSSTVFHNVIDSGVVLGLPVNEGSGDCVDYSGNGNNGTVDSAVWVAGGKFVASGLEFNVSDKISFVDDPLFGLTAYSMVGYINFTGLVNEAQDVFGDRSADNPIGVLVRYGTNGLKPHVVTSPTGFLLFQGSEPTVNVWSCLVNSFSCPNLRLYVNGVEDVAGPAVRDEALDASAVRSFTVGYGAVDGNSFDGVLSGFYVLNYGLSVAEVDDFNSYYPQCSTVNTGCLYFRPFVGVEPQPLSFGDVELFVPYPTADVDFNEFEVDVLLVLAVLVVGFVCFMVFVKYRR